MKRIVTALISCMFWFGAQADGYYGIGTSAAFDLNLREVDSTLLEGAAVHYGGAITNDETWAAGSVHVVYGTIIVATNVTLTIEPGAVVKFLGGGLYAAGTCVANGVTFTDIADDVVGGGHAGRVTLPMPSYELKGNVETDGATRIRFAKNGDEFAADGASGVFALSLRTDVEISAGAVEHGGGTLVADETWAAGSVHVVYGTIIVATNATLTIEPGAVVKFLGGGLYAAGTCVANGVTFTDIADDVVGGGHAGRVTLPMPSYELKGNVETDGATRIRFAKNGDEFAAEGASGVVRIDIADDEFRFAHEEESIVFSSKWANGTDVKVAVTRPDGGIEILVDEGGPSFGVAPWTKPAPPGLYEFRHVSGGETLTAKFAVVDGVVHDGTIVGSETWGMDKVHIVGNNLNVADGATLTIEPGAVVKFVDGKVLTVENGGICIAEGVIFTSIYDDTVGGDTLNDGTATEPLPNGYAIVGFVRDDLATEYRYGVQAYSGLLAGEVVLRKEKTYIIDGTLTVASGASLTIPAGTVVKFTEGSALKVAEGGVCIAEGAIFTHVADDTIGGDTMGDGDATKPEYGRYTVDVAVLDSDSTEYRYSAPISTSGTISGNVVWRARQVYRVTGNLTLASGATLTIAPGSIIKFDQNVSLSVNSGATLNAQGTRSSPIIFTSVRDDEHGGDTNGDGDATRPNPGDWVKIGIYNGTANFNYAKILYSSRNATTGAINMDGSSGKVVFTNGEIAHTAYDAIGVESGNCYVTNSVIHDCLLAFRHWTKDPIVNCVIYDCGRLTQGGGQHFYNCIFSRITETWEAFGFPQNGTTYNNCCFWNEGGSVLTAEGTQDALTVCGKNGNIWDDPLFVDAANGDFRIAANSPCVDAGDATVAPAKDYFGQKRYAINGLAPTGVPDASGAYADIGIYELQPRNATSDVDFEAIAVSMPNNITIGEKVLVAWRVSNIGTEKAQGEWEDRLELVSANGVVALGTVLMRKTVEPNCEYLMSREFTVPAIAEGSYSVRLRVNCSGGVDEGSLMANNMCLSESQLTVTLPTRELGPFSVSVPSRQSISFRLGTGTTSLFVADPHGALNVSMRVVDSETGRVRIVSGVPVNGGVVLSLPADMTNAQSAVVVIDNESWSAQTAVCEASQVKCAVKAYSPERIGNKAASVVSLVGYGMDYVVDAKLSRGGVNIPCSVLSRSTGELALNVEGSGCGAGTYVLSLELTDGGTVPVGDVEIFSNGIGPKFEAELDIPSATRFGRMYSGRVIYRNAGDADMMAPVLVLSASGAAIGFDDIANESGRIEFVGIGATSPHGVLKAGEEAYVNFKFCSGESPRFSLDMLTGSSQKWADQLEAISLCATEVNGLGRKVVALEDILDRVKRNELGRCAVSGAVEVNGSRVGGVKVSAETPDGETVAVSDTDSDGIFILDSLTNGSNYVLRVESGVSAPQMEITMPASGNLTGVCIEALAERTLRITLAGVKDEEATGIVRVCGDTGAELGSCSVNEGIVTYSSTNSIDAIVVNVRLDSGRQASSAALVSPIDDLWGMDVVVDFSDSILVTGKVIGVSSGTVRIRSIDGNVTGEASIDGNGKYAIGGLEPGEYISDVVGGSVITASQTLTLEPGCDANLDFSVSVCQTGAVSVDIANVDEDVFLVVAAADGGAGFCYAVSNGLFQIEGMPYGTYDLYLRNSDGQTVSEVTGCTIGDALATVSLSLAERIECVGNIVDVSGNPVSGFVDISPVKGDTWRVDSGENGEVSFSIPAGRYWFRGGAAGCSDVAFYADVRGSMRFVMRLGENYQSDNEQEYEEIEFEDDVVLPSISGDVTGAEANPIMLTFISQDNEILDEVELLPPHGVLKKDILPEASDYAYIWATKENGTGVLWEKSEFEALANTIDMQTGLRHLDVRVYADSGKTIPVWGADVRLTGVHSNIVSQTTDTSGVAHFVVTPGVYEVTVGRSFVGQNAPGIFSIDLDQDVSESIVFSAAAGGEAVTVESVPRLAQVGRTRIMDGRYRLFSTADKAQALLNWGKQLGKDSWSMIKLVFPPSYVKRVMVPYNAVSVYSLKWGLPVLEEPTYKCEHNLKTWNDYKIARMEYDFYLSQAKADRELSGLALFKFYLTGADKFAGYNFNYAVGNTVGSILESLIVKREREFDEEAENLTQNLAGTAVDLSEIDDLTVAETNLKNALSIDQNALTAQKAQLQMYDDVAEEIENMKIKAPHLVSKDEEKRLLVYRQTTTELRKRIAELEKRISENSKRLGEITAKLGKLKKWTKVLAKHAGRFKVIKKAGKIVKILAIVDDYNELRQLAGEADAYITSLNKSLGGVARAHVKLCSLAEKGYHDSCGGDNLDNNSVTNITDDFTFTYKSQDPNEMVGPAGVGEKRCVKADDWMDYTIYFENMTNATAAAQDIYVTLPKDAGLDWSTFELGEVVFGGNIDTALSGSYAGESFYPKNRS